MKQFLIFICLTILISACAQNSSDYKLETQMLECFYQQHKAQNIDVKPIITKLENIMIKHQLLKDNSGESYISLIEQIRDNKETQFNNPALIADLKSVGYIPSSVFCSDSTFIQKLSDADMKSSKLKKLFDLYDNVLASADFSTNKIATEVLKLMNAKDFNHDYYRTLGLVMFSSLILSNDNLSGLERRPPVTANNQEANLNENNQLKILVDNKSQILINGQIVKTNELKAVVKKFILETADKSELVMPQYGKQVKLLGLISIQNQKGSSYDVYLNVQNQLLSVYNEIRDTYSMRIFKKTYSQLDEEKQKVIKELVPMQIRETEPE